MYTILVDKNKIKTIKKFLIPLIKDIQDILLYNNVNVQILTSMLKTNSLMLYEDDIVYLNAYIKVISSPFKNNEEGLAKFIFKAVKYLFDNNNLSLQIINENIKTNIIYLKGEHQVKFILNFNIVKINKYGKYSLLRYINNEYIFIDIEESKSINKKIKRIKEHHLWEQLKDLYLFNLNKYRILEINYLKIYIQAVDEIYKKYIVKQS